MQQPLQETAPFSVSDFSYLYLLVWTEVPFCLLMSLGCRYLQQGPDMTSISSFHAGECPEQGQCCLLHLTRILLSLSVPNDKLTSSLQKYTENQKIRENFSYFHFSPLLWEENARNMFCLRAPLPLPWLVLCSVLQGSCLRPYDFHVPNFAVRG